MVKKAGYESCFFPVGRYLGSWTGLAILMASFFLSSCKETRLPKKEPAREHEYATFYNLGKVLAIGPKAESLAARGTVPVKASKLPGVEKALGERRAKALSAVLDKAGIKKILVDPHTAVRAPIPDDNVLTRLALLRSLARYSARLITKDLILYERFDPPSGLTREVKARLLEIARNTMKGKAIGSFSKDRKVILKKGDWEVTLCLRPKGRHLGFYYARAKTLSGAVIKAARSARKGYEKKGFQNKYGRLAVALDKSLTVEIGVIFDKGVLKGPRDDELLWRTFEPGLYGAVVRNKARNFTLPPWYSVTRNKDSTADFLKALMKWAGLPEKAYLDQDLELKRFRIIHFRENGPGGPVQDLYRGLGSPPSMKDMTRERIKKAIAGLARWIRVNQKDPSGRFVYRYFPSVDKYSKPKEFNFVRHCVGIFGLLLAQQVAPNPANLKTIEAGWRFMEAHLKWGGPPLDREGRPLEQIKTWHGKPLPGPKVALLMYKPSDGGPPVAKMGAAAVAILGLTQAEKSGVELTPEKQKLLDGLAAFVEYMERDEGGFYHYYAGPGTSYYNWRNSIYPGEILYAVARLYGKYKDEKWKKIFRKSMETNMKWFKERMDKRRPDGLYEERLRKELVQFQPWIAMAMEEMYRHDPDPRYLENSNLVSNWIIDSYQFTPGKAPYPDYLGGYFKVAFEVPAMHTFVYTEGTAASFMLAKEAGAPREVQEKFRTAALTAARFIIQQQVEKGRNDYYFPNPELAWGGVRYCLTHNKQRIDYTYHAMSALYRVFMATDQADLAAVSKIEEPGWD
ncbi:MAG: hypothetical protein GXP49_15345 [Deltaproteobacteria bacterium]|nr:hypothetical protein [Deltaproteobacteria bacterium]